MKRVLAIFICIILMAGAGVSTCAEMTENITGYVNADGTNGIVIYEDGEKRYISEVVIFSGGNYLKENLNSILAYKGYNVFNYDLLYNTGRDYLYIGYKTTKTPFKAIRGMKMTPDGNPKAFTDETGASYTPVSRIHEENGKFASVTTVAYATSRSSKRALYVSYDESAGEPVLADLFYSNISDDIPDNYIVIENRDGTAADFTEGSGTNPHTYVGYKADADYQKTYVSVDGEDDEVIYYGGNPMRRGPVVMSIFSPSQAGIIIILLVAVIVVAVIIIVKRKKKIS